MRDIMKHSGFIYQGYNERRATKYLTVKEWGRFNKTLVKNIDGTEFYFNIQEYLCKKYDVILTDHKTRKEKIIGWMKTNLTQRNLDKGIKTFNDGVENFTKELSNFSNAFGDKNSERATKEFLGISGKGSKPNVNVWGKQKQFTKIWSDQKPRKPRKSRAKKGHSRHEQNMKKIWGTKRR